MDRTEKRELVAELRQLFAETAIVIVTRNHGMTVAQVSDLRNRMRAANARYKVAKNRLARIALDGSSYDASIAPFMVGPTALSTSDDVVGAAKVIADFAKTTDKIEIIGGAMGGTPLDVAAIKTLAELPSLDELRAKLVGLVQAPATKLAQLATAPATKLARVIGAYADSGKDAA